MNEIMKKKNVKSPIQHSKGGFNLRELRNRNPKFHPESSIYFIHFMLTKNQRLKMDLCSFRFPRKGFEIEAVPLNSTGKGKLLRLANQNLN